MARRKPTPPAVVINDLDEADAVMREMAVCGREIERINTTMAEAVDAVKTEAKEMAVPHQARLKELEESLAAYSSYQRRALFTNGKSLSRTFGKFGFRKSTVLKPATKNTWGGVLEKLRKLGLTSAIRVREEVSKEVLQDWPDDRLEEVGARRVSSDKFWVEIDQAALDDGAVTGG